MTEYSEKGSSQEVRRRVESTNSKISLVYGPTFVVLVVEAGTPQSRVEVGNHGELDGIVVLVDDGGGHGLGGVEPEVGGHGQGQGARGRQPEGQRRQRQYPHRAALVHGAAVGRYPAGRRGGAVRGAN